MELFLEIGCFVFRVECDRDSFFVGPTCPSNSVDIVSDIRGEIEVDDHIDIGDIESSGSNVSG